MPKKRGTPFFHTEEFKKLHALWVTGKKIKVVREGKVTFQVTPSKLARAGFIDIELPGSGLKSKNNRSQSYLQQEELSHISSALCAYVQNPSVKLKAFEKKILLLRSEGVYNKIIIQKTKRSHQTVWRVIRKHQPLALGLYAEEGPLE